MCGSCADGVAGLTINIMADQLENLLTKIAALERTVADLKAGADEKKQETRRASYVVSAEDGAKSAETRARNETLKGQTAGARPIGGFEGAAAQAAISARTKATGGVGFRTTADFDSASASEEESTRGAGSLPTGYTYEEFTICDSGTPASRWWPTWTSDPS